MALQRDRTRINVTGVEQLKAEQITSGGVATTMSDIGYLQNAEIQDNHTMVESTHANGDFVHSQSGARTAKLVATIKQSGIDEINLVKNAKGKFFHAYFKTTTDSGLVQEFYAPCCTITPGIKLVQQSATERTIEVTFNLLVPKGAVTVTPAGLNVAAGQPYTLVENANALGQVTTATGTIYTAAV